jgi:predicted O-methyltransferase YrrM
MHHIRPYKVFTLVQADRADRVVRIPIPARRGTGGVSLLETFLLIAASKVVGATRIFEFGTFMGGTTLNLALNVPEVAQIFTLDLGASHAQVAQQHPADAPLTRTHLEAENALDFSESSVSSKISTLKGDSTKFDFGPWEDSIDLVFIDGGHDLATAKSDTESALRMVRKDRLSCILWHDYHNWEYSGLTQYLDDLSQELDIFHVQDTMLCVWFNDHGGPVRNHMVSES